MGSLPVFYDYLNSGRAITDSGSIYENGTLRFGHQYVLGSPQPWYAFGHGLSYATFEYGAVRLDRTAASVGDTVTVTVDVRNTSPDGRAGAEVVQVYVALDEPASSSSSSPGVVVAPNRQLKGFEKVTIPAGATVTVEIPLRVDALGLWDERMRYVVAPGRYTVLVGRSAVDIRGRASFEVVG